MFPCNSSSSSRVDASKFTKYGSRSCSLRLRDVGGKRLRKGPFPGPDEAWSEGDGEVAEDDFSFADDEGIGSQACAGFGFAGSSGGALRLFLGMEETGCE